MKSPIMGVEPLLSKSARAGIYVDFIANDGIMDDTYQELTTPPGARD